MINVYDMTPISTTYVNRIGLRILAFFSVTIDDLIDLAGCQLMETRQGGHTVHLPQHRGLIYDNDQRGPVAMVRFLDRSIDREVEQAAVAAYRQLKQQAA